MLEEFSCNGNCVKIVILMIQIILPAKKLAWRSRDVRSTQLTIPIHLIVSQVLPAREKHIISKGQFSDHVIR